MDKLKKIITGFLVFAIMLSIVPSKALAKDGSVSTLKEDFVYKYSGVDLVSKNFERNEMTTKEEEAYDALLEIIYEENKSVAIEEGYTKEEYINLADEILSENLKIEDIQSNDFTFYSASHGTISTKMLGGILNGVITAVLITTGVGSVAELIKKMGKEAAKDWVEKHVKKAVVNKLTAIGLGAFGVFAGNIIKGIIEAYIDPGQWLAERIDGNDKIPNNGYIEVW